MYLRHLTGYTYIKGYFLVYSLGDKGAPKRRTQKDLGLGSSDDNQDALFFRTDFTARQSRVGYSLSPRCGDAYSHFEFFGNFLEAGDFHYLT